MGVGECCGMAGSSSFGIKQSNSMCHYGKQQSVPQCKAQGPDPNCSEWAFQNHVDVSVLA